MLIAFEGIDGSGKTTLSKELYKFLIRRGIKAVWTCEPYEKKIRELILSEDQSPWVETLLFLSDRGIHVRKFVKPHLQRGYTVITDRFYLSTLAYQGFGRGLELKILEELNNKVTEGLKPDITFLIDLPIEVALERLEKRGNSKSKFEKEEFLKRVRKGFLKLAEENKNIVILQGNGNIYSLMGQILKHLYLFLQKKL
ncbi:MAG TPA: dTMP kinase [Aquifex aeolicus]|uniref:Thymidylate kinase n=1 Tax=Aquifex aeolicus TaxID=63363 RepID=A0A9D1CF85_AQUAO|nr:dTMP kinase [Aquificales bacterium]HIP98156.1 dTMP kinase [Aquifex aeolicus]HIQ26563.1 dTMP kinase [Aquifex aeolicus]